MKPEARQHAILIGLLVATTLIAYLPVLRADFVNWDDGLYVTENPLVAELTGANLIEIFTSFHSLNYHPLALLSHAVDVRLFGYEPFFHHLVNLLLHVANTLLVFLLFRIVAGNQTTAFVVALLFGLHPAHVESVAWVTERRDVLYSFFYLLAAIAWCRGGESHMPSVGAHGRAPLRRLSPEILDRLALGLFLLALLSKGMAATLPAVLLLFEWYRGRGITRATLGRLMPFLLLAVLFIGIGIAARMSGEDVVQTAPWSVTENLVRPAERVLFYLGKTLAPLKLSVVYPEWTSGRGLGGGLALLGLGLMLWVSALPTRARRPLLFGFGFFVVTLLPILLIVPSKSALEISEVNDRYLYLAMLGPFFIVAWFLERLPAKRRSEDRRSKDDGGDASRRLAVQDTMDREAAVPPPARSKETGSPRAMARGDGGEAGRSHDLVVPGERFRPAGLVAVAAIALVLMVLTWRQSAIWRDSLTLWNHVVTAYPQQHIAWRQRGEARRKARVFVAAESDYRRALSLAPHDEAALRHLVMMTLSRGDTATAESMLSEAIGRAAMDTANLLFLRGRLRLDDGEMAAAIEDFNAALRANPAHVDALVNRGIARLELGEDEAALFDLDKVLRLDDSVNYREAGFQIRPPPARLSAAERDRPVGQRLVFGMAYFTRGVILERRRESIKALLDFNQAARYDPHNPDVYYNRGLALLSLNLETEAYRDFTSARSARPRDPAIANNLAIATAKLGRTREAMALFERLLIDHPDHVETLSNLGLALLQLGEHAAAERHFTRAIELAPTAVEAWSGRGVCRTASGDLRGAIADLTRAITLSGGSAQLFANRAQAQAQSGNFRAALADLDRADALAPGEPAILHGRAWMLANLGRKRDARDVLERIRAAGHPVDPGLLRELTP